MSNERPGSAPASGSPVARYAGVGCVMMVAGAASGAMVAVFISKIVAFFMRIPDCPEMTVPCNWGFFMMPGAFIGAVSLPTLVIWKIRQSVRDAERARELDNR